MERKLTAIMAADVVGYSRLMGADEAGTHGGAQALRASAKPSQAQGMGQASTSSTGYYCVSPSTRTKSTSDPV